MPILKNAKKALRVSKRKNIVNGRIKSRMKTAVDKVKKSPSQVNLALAFSAIDRAVKKNILHKNKAARLKSGLSKKLDSKKA
jgi:small subunit ribosomal protein S20